MQNGKEIITLLLLCLQTSNKVLAYSSFVPVLPSVCDEFLTSHGGVPLNNTGPKRVWVELWDSSRQNQQSCIERGVSYKGNLLCAGDRSLRPDFFFCFAVSIKAEDLSVANRSAHIKGFLLGTTAGTLPGDRYGDPPQFASELSCRRDETGRRRKTISHKWV